jgi:hypothetical protein
MSELPDAPLHPRPTDDEAWAYERMVERLLRETMIGGHGGTTRTVLWADVRGHYPSAQVVIGFRDLSGEEGEGEWELWDQGNQINGQWDAPSDLVSTFRASWFKPRVERITRPASPGDERDS